MAATTSSRVLIADGDPIVRRALYKKLLDLDVYSDCVVNGKQALEKLEEQPYAVILLDLDITVVDAERVLDRIRLIPSLDRPIVLAIGAEGGARTTDFEVVQVLLKKPLRVSQVADVVKSCVLTAAQHRATRAEPVTQQTRDRGEKTV